MPTLKQPPASYDDGLGLFRSRFRCRPTEEVLDYGNDRRFAEATHCSNYKRQQEIYLRLGAGDERIKRCISHWVLAQPALADVCNDLAMLAEGHYVAAAEAITACPRRTMRPAAVRLGVYRALLHKLLARGWRQLDKPVRIPAWRKLALVIRHGLAGR
jgi:hypothetical protein